MPYQFVDEIATADIAFEAWGEDLEEMLAAAADATMNVMVSDLDTIGRKRSFDIEVKAEATDMLLFALLQELIYYKDADRLLLRIEDVIVGYNDGSYFVTAKAYGEEIDPSRHDLLVDVKAVTLHKFKVEQTVRGWETLVILDI
ncbi:MAG: archease [Syntrophobacteraceae bacterium]